MINRVTHQTVQRSTLANLQLNLTAMADMQGKLSSGRKISKPSDDPAATSRALQLRSEARATTQYSRNADDGAGWLSTVDSALQTTSAQLRRARDLVMQGSNDGVLSPQSREALAAEIDGIREGLLDTANSSYIGRSVFAGTSDAGHAFDRTTYAWTGTPGSSVERRVTPDSTVRADGDGLAVFGAGATSVFALLDDIAADLRAGTPVAGRLTALDARLDSTLGELASVGTRYGQITAAQSGTEATLASLKAELSGVEDIDVAETIMNIQMQEVAYQAALGAAARVLQPSLLDYLR